MDPVSVERETTYESPAQAAEEAEGLRHRAPHHPPASFAAGAAAAAPLPIYSQKNFVNTPAIPVVPLREVPDTPAQEMPGLFPVAVDEYPSDDDEPTLSELAATTRDAVKSTVSNVASVATGFFRNVSRRVSRNFEPIETEPVETTTTQQPTGSVMDTVAGAASQLRDQAAAVIQPATHPVPVDISAQRDLVDNEPHPTAETAGKKTGDVIGSVAGTVVAAASAAREAVGGIVEKVAPTTTTTTTTTSPDSNLGLLSTPEQINAPHVGDELLAAPIAARDIPPVVVTPIETSAYATPIESDVIPQQQQSTPLAETAKEGTAAAKQAAGDSYVATRETLKQAQDVAPQVLAAGKESAADSYGSAYEQAAARTANLPATIKQTAQSAAATVGNVVEQAYTKVAPVVGAPPAEVARENLAYATKPEVIKSTASSAATRARDVILTAQDVVESTAQTATEKAGQIYDATAQTSRRAVDTTSSIVTPAATVARESTVHSYTHSKEATTHALEKVVDKVVEYETVAKVLTTDAVHNAVEVGEAVYHKVADAGHTAATAASNTFEKAKHVAGDVTHRATETASSASEKAGQYTTPIIASTSNVLHRAADTTASAGRSVGTTAANVAAGAYNTAVGAAQTATQAASNVASGTYNTAVGATHAVTQTASNVVTGTYNTALGATHTVAEKASNLLPSSARSRSASNAPEEVVDAVAPRRPSISERAGAAANAAGAVAKEVGTSAIAVPVAAVTGVTHLAAAGANAIVAGASAVGSAASSAAHTAVSVPIAVGQRAKRAISPAPKQREALTVATESTPGTSATEAPASPSLVQRAAAIPSTVASAIRPGPSHAETLRTLDQPVGPTITERATGAAGSAISAAAAVPAAITHKVIDTAAAVGQGTADAVTGTASAVKSAGTSVVSGVIAAPGAIVHGVASAGSSVVHGVVAAPAAIVHGVASAGNTVVSGVASAGSAVISAPAAVASTVASVLPGGKKPTETEDHQASPVVAETGVRNLPEWKQGTADSTAPEEEKPTSVEELKYAEEIERERRDRPGATGRQFLQHSHEEARAFTEGIREHLGEGGNIPALNVPRRELVREAEEVERADREAAEAYQRGLAAEQARAFSEGLAGASGSGDRLKSAADIALGRRLEDEIEKERELRSGEGNAEEGAHNVATAFREGVADEGNGAVNLAKRALTREAEEIARDEKTAGSQIQNQQSAEKVASLFQAGISGDSKTPAASVAKLGQLRTAEDIEREERIVDKKALESHAHDEAKIVKDALQSGSIELHHTTGGYKLNELEQLEEAERERRIKEGEHPTASATADAVREGLEQARGSAEVPPALHIAEREQLKSLEEDERADRVQSHDQLRTSGSPTRLAFALRAGLLRDHHNPAVDVARHAAEEHPAESSLTGKHASGITPSTLNADKETAPTSVYKQEKANLSSDVPSTAPIQEWSPSSKVLGTSSLVPEGESSSSAPSLGEEKEGRRSPPSTPYESSNIPQIIAPTPVNASSSQGFSLPISDDLASPIPQHDTLHDYAQPRASAAGDRPPTPNRDASIGKISGDDKLGLETIRPAPSDDPAAVPVDSNPTNRKVSTDSTSSTQSGSTGSRRRHFDPEHPHRVHAVLEKAVGKIEAAFGKVLKKESLVVGGHERVAEGAAELDLIKQRRRSSAGTSPTRTH